MIELINISKTHDGGKNFVINNVNLTVEQGETLVILGSSGAGKSTLLKMVNRLIIPNQGMIKVNAKNVQDYDRIQLRRSMGYVFQGIGLFPHLTVAENITILLRLIKCSKKQQLKRAYELLELVGLEPDLFAQRYPNELSGGQQQRVGVGRALAMNPDYLLMDEPFAALDAITRSDLQYEILKLKKQLNKTILFVTHDVFEALRVGDRLAVMHNGSLEQVGTKKELIHTPATTFVSELFQKIAKQAESYVEAFK